MEPVTATTTSAAMVARARAASRTLATASANERAAALQQVALRLEQAAADVLGANARDLARGREAGLSAALLDRLALDEERLAAIAAAVREVAALPDPLGEELERRTLPNGLDLQRIRVPFGVICVVYEARPNVTVDAAAIAIKTGNAAILRGSSTAVATNTALMACVQEGLVAGGLDGAAVQLFDPSDRDGFLELISTEGSVDLVIPRGGEGLKQFLYEHARVPILAAAGGTCHVYVDATADREMARDILLNAKTQRPGVCNAAETLLVHADRADDLYPDLCDALRAAGVEVVEDPQEYGTEFLDLRISAALVDSLEAAIEHVNRYGTGHSEAIVTSDPAAAERFVAGVDAACVYVNASTRFTDGGVFGMGAEVGISTNKLHARGPIGLRELTTSKYVLRGSGQVRE